MDIGSFLGSNSVWMGLKVVLSVGFALYLVFALVIVKQVNKMTETLEIGLEGFIRMFALFHLLFAIATFLIALAIL